MAAHTPRPSSASPPRAQLPRLQQLPLDAITVYDTATHCYLLGTDSLQKNFHLLTCRKHSLEQATAHGGGGGGDSSTRPHTATSASEDGEEDRGGFTSSPTASCAPPYGGLDDLHDLTNYAVYSPTEAGALVDALQREHGASLRTLSATAFLGAVRFTAGYYVVLVTERRMAGHIGVHRVFEATGVELVSLQLDPEWVATAEAQVQQQQQQRRRRAGAAGGSGSFGGGGGGGYVSFTPTRTARGGGGGSHRSRPASAAAGAASTSSAASYLFQRRSLEELYRQRFLSSISRTSAFFYSHSYDLTNTLQRNMLAAGAAAAAAAAAAAEAAPATAEDDAEKSTTAPRSAGQRQPLSPCMRYVWNEFLLEPWQLADADGDLDSDLPTDGDGEEHDHSVGGAGLAVDTSGGGSTVPRYPPALSRWYVNLIHGYVTQRVVVVRRPAFHTLLLTLVARVSKASAGVRYLRRGLNSDGHVANHVEVEQIVSDESTWSEGFTAGALASYVQLRGSVPVRWYHPPTASRLLSKPTILLGPQDSQWSATSLHFQDLLEQYGAPILIHDLLKRKESHEREGVLGDAYRAAVRALVAAVDRHAAAVQLGDDDDGSVVAGADLLQYESTDLRSLGQLAWNSMTAMAEQHFSRVGCFATARRPGGGGGGSADDTATVTCVQSGVVRSNCLDCIDRTNLGQLFHGLHALGEQLCALGVLRHAADVRDSPAVSELLLDMYLAMGDAIATQYGGSAQVGAGVLHRGAGWDQLMGVKRLYHNVVGDREKQEAMNLLLGRKQPQPRRGSRACNLEMRAPGQPAAVSYANSFANSFASSAAPSLNASVTTATPGAAAALAAVATVDGAEPPASLLSGLRQAASRWWSTSTSASASSPSEAAAQRAAQHAAAEAEAEADYYEQVSGAPRLPALGQLTVWWVQPLRRFHIWYAACGIAVQERRSCSAAAAAASAEASPTQSTSPRHASPPPRLSLTAAAQGRRGSSRTRTRGRHGTSAAGTTPYGGDALAKQLLAAEMLAQERWWLHLATVERQACLAPLRRDGAAAVGALAAAEPPRDLRGGGVARHGPTAAGTFSVLSSTSSSFTVSPNSWGAATAEAAGGGGGGAGAAAAAAATASVHAMPRSLPSTALLAGSQSVTELDEHGGAATPLATAALASGEAQGTDVVTATASSATSSPGRGAAASRRVAAAAAAEAALVPFSAPSLTVPLSLFSEPWVLLRTTMHVLPVESVAGTRHTRMAQCTSGGGRCGGGGGGDVRGGAYSYSTTEAVARQLFGAVPPGAVTVAAQSSDDAALLLHGEHQPWRSPPDLHQHHTFPRVVRSSAFAGQQAALEQLAYQEVLWMADGAGVPPTPLQPTATTLPRPGVSSGPAAAPSSQEAADQRFTAALVVGGFGSPATWELEDVLRAAHRFLYPARVPAEVQRVLRSNRVRPAVSGAEMLEWRAAGQPGEEEAEMRQYWCERLTAQAHRPGPSAASAYVPRSSQLRRNTGATTASHASPTRRSPTRSPPQSHTTLSLRRGNSNGVCVDGPVQVAAALLYRLTRLVQLAGDTVSTATTTAATAAVATDPLDTAVGALWQDCLMTGHESLEDVSVGPPMPATNDTDTAAPDPLRRQWDLCRLLQPFFGVRRTLTPTTLHDVLHDFFSSMLLDTGADGRDPPQPRQRCDFHVRYSFVLSHHHRQQQQQQHVSHGPSPLRLTGEDAADDGGGGADGGGGGGGSGAVGGRLPHALFMGNSPSLSSSSPQGPSNIHSPSSAAAAAAAAARTLHIPATLKVRRCCAALDLHRWSTTRLSAASRHTTRESRAAAAWHLLWWAVDNNFIAPVVRRRGQATLEMLADETALFCVVSDVARVAVNVERRGREDVWRPQVSTTRTHTGAAVPGPSAIYGVEMSASSPLRLHRPLHRGALVSMLALSETLASLALFAATQVQEFIRDRVVHGWLRPSASTTTTISSSSSGVTGVTIDGGAVTAAVVVQRFHRLADECLLSLQSVMVALHHTSLDVLTRDAAMHSYITFFINVFNAVYVAAWLTNVKELIGNGAAAAAAAAAESSVPRRSSSSSSNARHHQAAPRTQTPRTVDLFPLPTLCNTSRACFMRVYGVVIGGVFLSLEAMKHGILGGNRPAPHCEQPLWPPRGRGDGAAADSPPCDEARWQREMERLVPLHMRADVDEAVRLRSLRRHPQLRAALHLTDMCAALDPATAVVDRDRCRSTQPWRDSGRRGSCAVHPTTTPRIDAATAAATGSLRRSACASRSPPPPPPPPPPLPCKGRDARAHRRQLHRELVDLWTVDVVRHLPFRMLCQLIDTYLPPPVLHLCSSGGADGESGGSGGDGVGGLDGGAAPSGGHAGDPRNPLTIEGRDRVPWYLQPLLSTAALAHTTLQSSTLGAAYAVARDGDGATAGTLVPGVGHDANGVLLQPCRMWSSPPYYVVGGDGMSGDEAVTHSSHLLQALAGSYLGPTLYQPSGHGGPAQHLCMPLHADEAFAQLRATEAAFRSALLATDPHLFCSNSSSSSGTAAPAAGSARRPSRSPSLLSPPPPAATTTSPGPSMRGVHPTTSSSAAAGAVGGGMPPMHQFSGSNATATATCSTTLRSAMKPLLYEWCRTVEEGMTNAALLSRHTSQLRITLKLVRLLEESHASGEAVRAAQAAAAAVNGHDVVD
ncbi:inositol polyphosphate phosphatase [Novymonas esmeraldas]|uniref:Inositol polyphosphate phosphatase n=1 Tax=Novymonas esmeraldas TaxID=1808958 RepID=A0AAW0EJD5_9TRYP